MSWLIKSSCGLSGGKPSAITSKIAGTPSGAPPEQRTTSDGTMVGTVILDFRAVSGKPINLPLAEHEEVRHAIRQPRLVPYRYNGNPVARRTSRYRARPSKRRATARRQPAQAAEEWAGHL